MAPVSYTHLRAHETSQDRVCRLLREKGGYSSAASDVYKRQEVTSTSRRNQLDFLTNTFSHDLFPLST
ncbi:hypothetical protein ACX3V1_08360 [Escherichia coli]